MRVRIRLWLLVTLACALAALAIFALRRTPQRTPPPARSIAQEMATQRSTPIAVLPVVPLQGGALGAKQSVETTQYVALGGGSAPESTEVSLEQNLALAQQVFKGRGVLLFGGGPGSLSVRELDAAKPADPLLVRLGELFQPRPGRGSMYRESTLPALAATLQTVESELIAALSHGDTPLLVYIAAHGEQGEHPRDNAVVVWGGERLTVKRLAELHEAHPRPLRLLSASCFSGGFAELAFAAADSERGFTGVPRCGLFAGTADRETSGCDPDPDRSKQESYSLHFLQALAGRDRNGLALPPSELDLDQVPGISLLEAHVRASVSAQSIDVPTTTSERFLRSVQHASEAEDGSLVPEFAALARRLGQASRLSSAHEVRERWSSVERELGELDARLDAADVVVQARFGELSARLLARWPVLDDAYHPRFAELLARERSAITQALDAWPEAKRFDEAQRSYDALDTAYQALEQQDAMLLRLLRAHETLGLAAALHHRGGTPWKQFQELLDCERYVPAD